MEFVARSDTGLLRRRNEDFVAVDGALGLALLADGMGGLPDGHVASRVAADSALVHLRRGPPPAPDGFSSRALEAAVQVANEQVRRRAGAAGMGTTLLLASIGASAARLAHVGDSRAYLLTNRGGLRQLTRDHSLVQDLVDDGLLDRSQARHAANRNVITRALGLAPMVEPDIEQFTVAAGDLLLLCSDGLWEMLEDDAIVALLKACEPGQDGLAACADALVQAANDAGGHDNVSVVLVRKGRFCAR